MSIDMKRGSLLPIGGENYVNPLRLLAIVAADSAPARRLIQEARERQALVDASGGRKTRALLIMDSEHVIASALSPTELQERLAEEA